MPTLSRTFSALSAEMNTYPESHLLPQLLAPASPPPPRPSSPLESFSFPLPPRHPRLEGPLSSPFPSRPRAGCSLSSLKPQSGPGSPSLPRQQT